MQMLWDLRFSRLWILWSSGMWQRVISKMCPENWGSGIVQNICKYLPTQTFSVLRDEQYIIFMPPRENVKCYGVLFVLDRMKYTCHYENRGFCSGKYERYAFSFFCNVMLFSLEEFSDISEEPFTKNSVNFFHTARWHT